MARLIDADALIRHAEETKITATFPNYTELSSETRNAIGMYGQYWKTLLEDAPTVEAETVKHGCWNRSGKSPWVKCSWCGESFSVSNGNVKERFNYCPNCSADMRDE